MIIVTIPTKSICGVAIYTACVLMLLSCVPGMFCDYSFCDETICVNNYCDEAAISANFFYCGVTVFDETNFCD